MSYIVAITSQGQITIPKELRKVLGIDKPSRVSVEKRGDEIVVKPIPDFLSLFGTLKPKKIPEDWEAIDKAVADAIGEDAVKGLK